MTPKTSLITVSFPDAAISLVMVAEHPGAQSLMTHLASLGVNSDATQIKTAFAQGFAQCDVIKVLPEPEAPAKPAAKASKKYTFVD